ncbi:hypothetical protein OG371_13455 [Amycolatopsis sp. NBC_01480]|nr:hypothetical protein [Amycolatopsis sp. NBC_01480]
MSSATSSTASCAASCAIRASRLVKRWINVRSTSLTTSRPTAMISGTNGAVNGSANAHSTSAAVTAIEINMPYLAFSMFSACSRNDAACCCARATNVAPIVLRLFAKLAKLVCTSPPTFAVTCCDSWLKPWPADAIRCATWSHSAASSRNASSSPCGQASPAMM